MFHFILSPARLVSWTVGNTRRVILRAVLALSSARISGGYWQLMEKHAWCVDGGRWGEMSNNWTITPRLPPAHVGVQFWPMERSD